MTDTPRRRRKRKLAEVIPLPATERQAQVACRWVYEAVGKELPKLEQLVVIAISKSEAGEDHCSVYASNNDPLKTLGILERAKRFVH